jgi:hypothetical protein
VGRELARRQFEDVLLLDCRVEQPCLVGLGAFVPASSSSCGSCGARSLGLSNDSRGVFRSKISLPLRFLQVWRHVVQARDLAPPDSVVR